MFGVIMGVIEGYNGTDFSKSFVLSVAVGVVMMMLVFLSMVVQVVTGSQLSILQNLTLIGALFGNMFSGSGTASRVMTLVLSFFYGMIDVLVGYSLFMVVHDFRKNYL